MFYFIQQKIKSNQNSQTRTMWFILYTSSGVKTPVSLNFDSYIQIK